jgi:VanZ family protein
MRVTEVGKTTTSIRVVAWLAVLAIIVLSVVPGDMRPHVLTTDHYEHFAAYFITGSLLGIGYSRPKQVLSIAVMLLLCSGTLEIVQLWIPGRTASVGDFIASAIGGWAALILTTCVVRWARVAGE